MENKKNYTLDELRLMSMYLGDYIMSEGYSMKTNTIKEGLDVTYIDSDGEYQFILPYNRECAIVIEENMLPAYYEGFFSDKYDRINCMTLEQFNSTVASIETVIESLGVYNREYLIGEEEFFAVAKLVEGDKIGDRAQATNAMKELQDANEFYRDALKTNLSVPLALDKYREELYKKTRDELTLTMVRFDFYIALGEFEKNNTPLTVRNVEITNKAYQEMLDLRGYLDTPENKLRIERYNEFDAKTKMEIKLYDGTTKIIHLAGDLADNVACIGAFHQAVEDCILNCNDNLSDAVIGELERKLNKANYDLSNNKNIDDVDLQSCREKLYQEASEALFKCKGNEYMWTREQFNKCVAKIQSQDFKSVQSAIDTKRELLVINDSYESILRQQCNGIGSKRREDIFREASKLIDKLIVNLSEDNDNYSVELEEDFYRLINTDIEGLSKSELESFEEELTTANERFRNVIGNEFKDAKRAKAFRRMMIRIGSQIAKLENSGNSKESSGDYDEVMKFLTQSGIKEGLEAQIGSVEDLAEKLGIILPGIKLYVSKPNREDMQIEREQRVQQVAQALRDANSILKELVTRRTLEIDKVKEVKQILNSIDFRELIGYQQTCSSHREKSLLMEVEELKISIGNLTETFNKNLECLKIKKI